MNRIAPWRLKWIAQNQCWKWTQIRATPDGGMFTHKDMA